jgi:hypothetical protein
MLKFSKVVVVVVVFFFSQINFFCEGNIESSRIMDLFK